MNVRTETTKLLARLVAGASDVQLDRWFGSRVAQRALFAAMAWTFEPNAAAGFEGAVVFELSGANVALWTVDITAGRARTRRGAALAPRLTLRLRVADFLRIAAGTLDPVRPLLEGRAEIEGDLEVAARLPEMFGIA
jgi:putative sterol carrier protein